MPIEQDTPDFYFPDIQNREFPLTPDREYDRLVTMSFFIWDAILQIFFSFIGILLPIFALLDLMLDKSRKMRPKDKKTDWFYGDEKYDRKMDERADKNNYRTL